MEILSKLYLELAQVVPKETKSFRELELEQKISDLQSEISGLRDLVPPPE